MKYLKREQFLWDYTEKGIIPSCYNAISLGENKITNSNYNPITQKVIYISLFPRILSSTIDNNNYSITKLRHLQLSSAGINIENSTDIDSHLKTFTSHSFRSNLKRLNKRLETCFSITYKMYFGNILKEEYDSLIDTLFEMQIKRLNQKKLKNNVDYKYKYYKKIAFPMINSSEASIFVIYNNSKPIGITLNFHREKIFFGTVTAFNIDYNKFGIGNLLVYKQLDWCIKNKYRFFDLGIEQLDYKKKWSNTLYDFEYQIIYKKKSIIAHIVKLIEVGKIYSKNIIKILNIDAISLKSILSFKKETISKNSSNTSIEIINDVNSLKHLNFSEVKIEDYQFLKKPLFNFLYSNSEHFNNTTILKLNEEDNAFIFRGINKIKKVIIS